MTRLEQLDPFNGRWSDEELAMLATEPAPGHLRILPLNAPPRTQAGVDALLRLRLTEIAFCRTRNGVEGLSFLRSMPMLEVIRLDGILAYASMTEMESLVDLLAECTRCTELTTPRQTTNAHLCRLLPSLPNLRTLVIKTSFKYGFFFGDLSFASSVPHLASTLERLVIDIRESTSPRHLDHLYDLRNLRHLDVCLLVFTDESFTQSDLDHAMAEFDTEQPATFRRDRWPHMINSHLQLCTSDDDDDYW